MDILNQYKSTKAIQQDLFKKINSIKSIKKYDINPDRFLILSELSKLEYKSICQNELAYNCRISTQSMSRSLPVLQNQGFITIRKSINDSRIHSIKINYAGMKVVDEGINELKKAS